MAEKSFVRIVEPFERRWADKSPFRSIVALTHPTAVLVFAGAVMLLSVVAAGGLSPAAVIVSLTLSMGFAQAAIGVFNEVCDYDIDRVTKPWRALAAGTLGLDDAKRLAFGLGALACVLAWFVSVPSLFLVLFGIALGFLYSARLKRTVFSWLPYVIAYPLPVIWIWVSLDKFVPSLLLIYPIAIPFAIGTHLCNQLRDFDEDKALGVCGLAQHLGKYHAIKSCEWLVLVSPMPLLLLSVARRSSPVWLVIIALGYWAVLLSVVRNNRQGTANKFRMLFRRLQVGGPLLLIGSLFVLGF